MLKPQWSVGEFHPGHPLANAKDEANFKRWHENMLAGFRPELQPIPLALPAPSPKALAPSSVPAPAPMQPGGRPEQPGGRPECPHKNITRKGTNQHIEMETCKDGGLVLKRAAKDASAIASQNTQKDAQQAACSHPRIARSSTSTTSARPDEARPLELFSIEQGQEIFRTCLLVARVKADEDGCQQMSSAAMHRILDAVSATMVVDAAPARASSYDLALDNKDNKQVSSGEFRGRTFKDVLENEPKYVQWCMAQSDTNKQPQVERVCQLHPAQDQSTFWLDGNFWWRI
eukprot:s292_g32.t1